MKAQELKSKDGGIETLENVIGEMEQNIATLQDEIASLQVSITIDNAWLFLGTLLKELCSSTSPYTVKAVYSCRGTGEHGQCQVF